MPCFSFVGGLLLGAVLQLAIPLPAAYEAQINSLVER